MLFRRLSFPPDSLFCLFNNCQLSGFYHLYESTDGLQIKKPLTRSSKSMLKAQQESFA
jgi:hypothetical protein